MSIVLNNSIDLSFKNTELSFTNLSSDSFKSSKSFIFLLYRNG